MIYALYAIDWTEYERGWGQRPDGRTLHFSLEEANKYIKDYWDSMPDGPAPDIYSRPDTPKLVEVDKKTYDDFVKSQKKKKIS
jgi:hypothetical protein